MYLLYTTSYFCFSKIITGGSDGDVRVWTSVDDDDPVTIGVGESVHAVLYSVRPC